MARPKPLSDAQFAKLIQTDEGERRTPEEAASLILTEVHGDDRAAEVVLWATWEELVGGEPGRRPAEGESAESQFLVRVIGAISDGSESPPVAENDAKRRATQAWRARSSTFGKVRNIVKAA